MNEVSIYFFAGDFVDVLRRYHDRRDQIYQTHNEVARLVHDLLTANQRVNIYSFVTPKYREERPINGLRIVDLGADSYSTKKLLKLAVAQDKADALVLFPNTELLSASLTTASRKLVVCANSYNGRGLRSTLAKWRIASLLNRSQIELVANHCLPATEHLAKIGVHREKLIAWDIDHPFAPDSIDPKAPTPRARFEAVYAGSVVEGKGVSDLIEAIALLRKQKLEIHCSLAGLGNIDAMKTLCSKLRVSDLFTFLGLISNTEVYNRMAAADLVVVPSRTEYPEGFPLTMFEAIASRTPIVCSDHPMFRTVMLDRCNASVFSAGNIEACADAIRRTLIDPELYSALSRNADLTWKKLLGPADWRTLILKWVVEGYGSSWIQDRMLNNLMAIEGAKLDGRGARSI